MTMRALLALLVIVAMPEALLAQVAKAPAKPAPAVAAPPAAPTAAAQRPAAPAPATPRPAAPPPATPVAVAPPPPVPPSAAPAQGAPAQPAVAPATAPAAVPNEGYTYQPDGRRDPFLSLLGTGNEPKVGKKGEGAAAFTVGEMSVRGIIQSKGQLLAMVQAPDEKTYVMHAGDKFADGVVKSVTPQGLIVIQDINDPLSIQKQREVRKLLRSLEDAKE
jgi:Tfp pilus assembly protein PilP